MQPQWRMGRTAGEYSPIAPERCRGCEPLPEEQERADVAEPGCVYDASAGNVRRSGEEQSSRTGLRTVRILLSRSFAVREHQSLEVKAEAFNLFNHANFSNPTAILPDSTVDVQPGTAYNSGLAAGFGSLNSTVGRTVGLGTSRQFQLSARFQF